MITREQIIDSLEMNYKYSNVNKYNTLVPQKLVIEIIKFLKAQDNTVCTKERCPMNASTISDDCNIKTCPWRTEGVKPRLSVSGLWYECPVCGKHLTRYEDYYCARCGKRVKWNG